MIIKIIFSLCEIVKKRLLGVFEIWFYEYVYDWRIEFFGCELVGIMVVGYY